MIPKFFHFIFGLRPQKEPFHLVHYLCIESCRRLNQPERIFFYYHHEPHGEYWEMVREHVNPVHVELVPFVSSYKYRDRLINPYRYAHHADFIRLEKLLEHGGVYADIDTLFVNPIPEELFQKSAVVGWEADIVDPNTGCYSSSICNAFIMAEKGAPFLRHWRNELENAFDGTWSNHSTLLPMRLSQKYSELVHIEPVRSFYHYPPSRAGIAGMLVDSHSDVDGIISLHLWAHLWWSKRRVDMSVFHSGLMTEDYLRTTETTYNRLARRFLPERSGISTSTEERFTLQPWNFGLLLKLWIKLAVLKLIPDQLYARARSLRTLFLSRWRYEIALGRIPSGGPADDHAIASVFLWDDFELNGLELRPEDVVLDLGLKPGSLGYLAHMLGSRSVHVLERNSARLAVLESGLGVVSGLTIHRSPDILREVASRRRTFRLVRIDETGDAPEMLQMLGDLSRISQFVGVCPGPSGPEDDTGVRRILANAGFKVRSRTADSGVVVFHASL